MSQEKSEKSKKAVANEIILFFKKFKITLLISIFIFIAFSINNKLIQIALFDYEFAWFEAQEIFEGYIPNQYVNVEDNAEYISGTTLKTVSHGHFEISDGGYLEVKKDIISKLTKDSLEATLIAIPIIFGCLIIIHYLMKSFRWVKKKSD